MAPTKTQRRVLVVSYTDKIRECLTDILPTKEFEISICIRSANEARRLLLSIDYDLVVINTPLPDEFGTDLAIDLSDGSTGILLITKSDNFDQVCYKVEDYGVYTLAKPFSLSSLYGAIKLLVATRMRLLKMEQKNKTLQEKMADIRVINRAKWLLIERLNMTEKDAHHYIEKQAMDTRITRREVAESIIRTYDK